MEFETHCIPFTQPEKARKYTPDFILPNGIVVETKGLFSTEDRDKMLWVTSQHPDLDIRMVFSNAKARLRKGSPTTYAMWCDKNGIKWADKTIPSGWFKEPARPARLTALSRLRKATKK